MQDNMILMAILVILGGIILSIIIYYGMRFLRGSITIHLSRTAFNPGDEIRGSLLLHTKKIIEGNRLLVSLVGTQETTSRRANKRERRRKEEIYRDEMIIREAHVYPAGERTNYDFTLKTPNPQQSDFATSTLGKTLVAAVSLLGFHKRRIVWVVEARLDAKGVDLYSSKRISINLAIS